MKNRILHVLLLAALAALVQGCGIFQEPARQVQLYTLSYPPAEGFKSEPPQPILLEVKPFRAAEPYRSARMVYAENEYSRSTYVYHKWLSEPAEMVGDLIIRDIRASGIAGIVFSSPHRAPTHILHATIESFYEDDSGDPWEAVLQITVTLASNQDRSPDSRMLLHKTYNARKTLEQNNPLGLAKAMSLALEEVSARVIKDISEHL